MHTVIKHPLIEVKLSHLRDEKTCNKDFREEINEIASFMCFEAAGLYKSYAVDNVPSDHVPTKKKKLIGTLAEAVFSPSFIVLAVTYIVIVLTK